VTARGVEAHALRGAMGHFATGVSVVTATGAGEVAFGTTANAISSLSLDPPLVLACLRRASETLAAIRSARTFAINLLAADQHALAERFARPSARGTWEGVVHRRSGGVPVLDGALATLECTLHELADGGDHTIVIGRVVAVDHQDHHVDPLLFYRGGFGALVPPEPAPEPAPVVTHPEIALPSALGALRMVPLAQSDSVEASVAVLVGEPRGSTGAAVHLHRGCLLGDALGSQACRGRERLHAILGRLERDGGPGVIVYHRDGAGGLGTCCLGVGHEGPPSDGELAAVHEAIALLGLHAPVLDEALAVPVG
jgi:flavin reductase (DIM6/NTAB) family NADH-FMN oxidoreductase RutF